MQANGELERLRAHVSEVENEMSELRREKMRQNSEVREPLEERERLIQQADNATLCARREVNKIMQVRVSLRGAINGLEKRLKDTKNELKDEADMLKVDRPHRVFVVLGLLVPSMSDIVVFLKQGRIAELKEGVVIPEAVRRRVQEELFKSTRWMERQQLIARESARMVRDKVLGRFPDLDLSFLPARLGEELLEDGSAEVEEGDDVEIVRDEVKVIVNEGGGKVDRSAPGEFTLSTVVEE